MLLPLLFTLTKAIDFDQSDSYFNSLKTNHLDYYDLNPPYLNDYLQLDNWQFGRDTIVGVNKFVRLTRDVQSQDGYIWSKRSKPKQSFVLEFEFSVNYKGSLSGDGFAFWITRECLRNGPVFGNMDYFTGLGIMFDTYANSRHTYPYIMGMIGDGKTHYDHDLDGNTQEAGGCAAEFRNRDKPSKVRITYLNGSKTLKMDYKVNPEDPYHRCFEINVELPDFAYFGFTGMTGGVTSEQDILSFKVWEITNDDSKPSSSPKHDYVNDQYQQSTQSHSTPPKSNSWGFFTWFVFLVLVAFVGYAGWVYYKTNKQDSYKRF